MRGGKVVAGADARERVALVAAGDGEHHEARAGERGTELLEGRSSRQLSQDEKAARATHVIANDGSLEALEEEVARLLAELTELTRGAA